MNKTTAILIIDMQKDFFVNDALKMQSEDLVKNINSLTAFARQNNIPVIWIRQVHKKDLSDLQKNSIKAICIEETEGANLLDGLVREKSDNEVKKPNYSGFFKTELNRFLGTYKINCLIVCGINTHACVRTTVIDAYQRNYDIIVAKDCVGSYHKEHHEITMKYFEPKIAKLMSNEEIMDYMR